MVYINSWLTAANQGQTIEVGDTVIHKQDSFECDVQHVPSAATEPGVGASWATVWTRTADASETPIATPSGLGDLISGTPADGDSVVFNASTGLWEPGAGGGGGVPADYAFYRSQTVLAMSNLPAGDTEFGGSNTPLRIPGSLALATEARIIIRQVANASAGSEMIAQYSTDGGSTWFDICAVTMGTALVGAGDIIIGPWTAVPAGAKAEVLTRAAGRGGNGVSDPSFYSVTLQVK